MAQHKFTALALTIPFLFGALNAFAGGTKERLSEPPIASNFTNRIIVKTIADPKGAISVADAATLASRLSVAAGQSLTFSHLSQNDVAIMKTAGKVSLIEANQIARRLSTQPGIEYAEPDVRMFRAVVPNDTRYAADQWSLKPVSPTNYGINAQTAWDTTTGLSSTVIAIIDTGIRPHADLASKIVAGYDFITDVATANDGNGRDNDPSDPGDWITLAESTAPGGDFEGCRVEDSSWHGTHVAGIAAAVTNNNTGIAGVNWNAQIQPIRALGKCGGFLSDIAAAIVWAAGGTVSGAPANATPAKIINMSLGGLSPVCGTTYSNAVAQARTLGSIVVAAAGNSGIGTLGARPANCEGVIAVSATDSDGLRAGYSNVGAPATISAPGGDVDSILSTLNTGTTTPGADSYAGYVGTSMASPAIAGVVSLMLAVRPTLTVNHIAAFMRGTATPYPAFSSNPFYDCGVAKCGDGIVNAAAAVAAASSCNAPPTGAPAAVGVSCNGDYDGNGIVDSMADGLIALRMRMGLSGASVTAGALGTCATRTTYASIRAWSNANCGTSYAP
jgi:serine protease